MAASHTAWLLGYTVSVHAGWGDTDGAGTTWQAVLDWPNAYKAAEGERRPASAIPESTVLLVTAARRCSDDYEVRVHNADSEKTDMDPAENQSYRPISNLSVYGWEPVVPADLKFVRVVQVAGEARL